MQFSSSTWRALTTATDCQVHCWNVAQNVGLPHSKLLEHTTFLSETLKPTNPLDI